MFVSRPVATDHMRFPPEKILELAYLRRDALPFAILSPHRLRDFF
jgi:hypothetical protein